MRARLAAHEYGSSASIFAFSFSVFSSTCTRGRYAGLVSGFSALGKSSVCHPWSIVMLFGRKGGGEKEILK